MTPTLDQYKEGATTWRHSHDGVSIILSHHGVRPDLDPITGRPHPGTWAYYLLIPEQMYPAQWDKFACVRGEGGFEHHGTAFDSVDFYSGITWASSEPYFDRNTMREWDAAKVGCDYNHLWDAESHYMNGYEDVLRDAKRSAEELVKAFPDRYHRCPYTGDWVSFAKTYVANNGARVSDEVANRSDVSEHWLPRSLT